MTSPVKLSLHSSTSWTLIEYPLYIVCFKGKSPQDTHKCSEDTGEADVTLSVLDGGCACIEERLYQTSSLKLPEAMVLVLMA